MGGVGHPREFVRARYWPCKTHFTLRDCFKIAYELRNAAHMQEFATGIAEQVRSGELTSEGPKFPDAKESPASLGCAG